MLTLFCWVYGDEAPFFVKVSPDKTVCDLQEAIIAKKPITFKNIEADKLILWKKNIVSRARSNFSESELQDNDLLDGADVIGNVFTEALPRESIHVIIKASAPPAPPPAVLPDEFQAGVNDKLDELLRRNTEEKTFTFSISGATVKQYDALMKNLELTRTAAIVEAQPTGKAAVPFVWGEEPESVQMVQCVDWFKKYISFPEGITVEDVSRNTLFFNSHFPSARNNANFRLTGTTDLIFVPQIYVDTQNLTSGVLVAVELQKNVKGGVNQAVLELLAASQVSNFPVVVLLTNLNMNWHFFWLGKNNVEAAVFQFQSGITVLEDILHDQGKGPYSSRYTWLQFLSYKTGKEVPARQPLQQALAPQGVDRILSRPKIYPYDRLSKPDIANMEDVFDEMDQEEIKEWKVQYLVRRYQETPA